MNSPKYLHRKTIASALIAVGVIVFVFALLRGFRYAPTGEKEVPDSALASSSVPVVTGGEPLRIIIPKINVDTTVEHVGITYKGNMSTPKDILNTGWYKYGTSPGEVGSAVIDGHVDNGFDLPGVFVNLKNLEKGDDVYIEMDDGRKLHFVVTDTEVYPYIEAPVQKIFAQKDLPRLNLITCEGDWLPDQKTDADRRVVYTVLINS